jgi:hypothetical protein
MTAISRMFTLAAVVVLLFFADAASAQKKKPATDAPAPTAAQIAPKPSNLFRDFLAQHIGTPSNLGVLTKLGGDYLIVEEENVPLVIPLASIQSVKVKKEKEDEESPEKTVLVIKLVAGE